MAYNSDCQSPWMTYSWLLCFGDAAWTLSDNCITPTLAHDPSKDANNYFLSPVWIWTKMVFWIAYYKMADLKNLSRLSLHVGSEWLECMSQLNKYFIGMRPYNLCDEICKSYQHRLIHFVGGFSQLWNIAGSIRIWGVTCLQWSTWYGITTWHWKASTQYGMALTWSSWYEYDIISHESGLKVTIIITWWNWGRNMYEG